MSGFPDEPPILPKAYYSIGEVCDLTGLKPHVLRYWETQFETLRPTKNRAGNRVYRPREVELVLLVKHLLYEEKFTIDGARQRLRELRRGGDLVEERQEVAGPELFQVMKEELHRLRALLTLEPGDVPSARMADDGGAGPDGSGPGNSETRRGSPPASPRGSDRPLASPTDPDPSGGRSSVEVDPWPQLRLDVGDP